MLSFILSLIVFAVGTGSGAPPAHFNNAASIQAGGSNQEIGGGGPVPMCPDPSNCPVR